MTSITSEVMGRLPAQIRLKYDSGSPASMRRGVINNPSATPSVFMALVYGAFLVRSNLQMRHSTQMQTPCVKQNIRKPVSTNRKVGIVNRRLRPLGHLCDVVRG